MLNSIDPEMVMEHIVSREVNSVKNNRPGLNDPTEPETLF